MDLIKEFSKQKILLIGDFMLDKYTTGRIERISPEAPVPILHVVNDSSQPGGAGNVVLNMLSLNADVLAIGRIGKDEEGNELKSALDEAGSDTDSLVIQDAYPTPTKNRFIANSQQVIRVDREEISPLPENLETALIKKLPELIKDIRIIALSDYGKGFLTDRLIAAVIDTANQANVPVVIDPKGVDFSKYRNSFMIKPNLSEAYNAANMPKTESLEKVAKKLFEVTNVQNLLITRSEDGITLFDRSMDRKDFPVISKEVQDVTGAGDTVLATLATSLANGLSMDEAIFLSNTAASIAIEHLGCARVNLFDINNRLSEIDRNKVPFNKKILAEA